MIKPYYHPKDSLHRNNSSLLKAKLKSFCNSMKSLSCSESFATKIYFPVRTLFSYFKKAARRRLRALLRLTALPTLLEVTNPNSNSFAGLKKATKEGVCHFLPLLYKELKSLELFSL